MRQALIIIVVLLVPLVAAADPAAAPPAAAAADLIANLAGRRRDRDRRRHLRRPSSRSTDDEVTVEIAPGTQVRMAKRASRGSSRGRGRGIRRRGRRGRTSSRTRRTKDLPPPRRPRKRKVRSPSSIARPRSSAANLSSRDDRPSQVPRIAAHRWRARRRRAARPAGLARPQKPTLGLDLQGGLEVVLKAPPPQQARTRPRRGLDRSVTIMRNRIDRLGVSEPEIRKQGGDQIVIQLAGVTDPAKAAELIGKTAQLQFYDLEDDIAARRASRRPDRSRRRTALRAARAGSVTGRTATSTQWYLFKEQEEASPGPAAVARGSCSSAAKDRCRRGRRSSASPPTGS